MIGTQDRRNAVMLIAEAVAGGARQSKACAEIGISERTYRRWTSRGDVQADQRPLVDRSAPSNKLSAAERQAVLASCNAEEFASLPPSQIVPRLADRAFTWLRSRVSIASKVGLAGCVSKGSSSTEAAPNLLGAASRPGVTRQQGRARSGPGILPGCQARSWACSSTST